MANHNKLRIALLILAGVTLFLALTIGIVFGIAIATTKNTIATENFSEFDPSIPSKILDIEGRLITEFASNEKREIVSIKDLPQHLIDALITREDKTFWTHPGFTLKGYFRAAKGVLTRQSLGGGSGITLQLAGDIYADRSEISIRRKLVELWWALQMERRFSKQEILEKYMNRMNMGPGIYGFEAASKYYFNHSAKEATLAESAILVILLASPTRYNPIRNPNSSRKMSREVLDQMVKEGYTTKEAADESFSAYWDNYDYTRVATAAFYNRDDKAPWFSQYVLRELESMLYGSIDLYKDGLTVHTTLNLDYQKVADRYMTRYLDQANKSYLESSSIRLGEAAGTYIPLAELMGLAFNLEPIFMNQSKIQNKAMEQYRTNINQTADALALMFGLESLKIATNASYGATKTELAKNTVECALITLDNDKGYVLALVGGSKFGGSNQLIRATQSMLQPGSCFKPLYYSAAIDSRLFTEGTLIYDAPVVFYNDDGTPFIPLNFRGEWKGQVLTWYALAKSMNVPSIKVLDGIGFDAAINRAAALLGITDQEEIRSTFPRLYPLGLGISSVSPLKMARAFSIFANQGKETTAISIRSIEDRNGKIILEPEKVLRTQQKKKGSAIQVISPQNAYVMTDMLKRVITDGTLAGPSYNGAIFTYKTAEGKKFVIPAAGKTGTTNNWGDAWTVGFTPYMTTAIWFGFDLPGNSLGVAQSGAVVAGAAWSNYMSEIHRGLPYRDFVRPQSGLVDVKVCSVSGLLPTEYCDEGTVNLLFYDDKGVPNRYCDLHQQKSEQAVDAIRMLTQQGSALGSTSIDSTLNFDIPDLDSLINSLKVPEPETTEKKDPASLLD